MPVFTIDTKNSITAHADQPSAMDGCQSFTTEKELAKLTTEWPAARLTEIWNCFAGVAPFDDLKPVKKFTDRASALARIWKAIQRLGGDVAPQSATVAKKAKGTTKKASSTQRPTRAKQGAMSARDDSKKATVLELLRPARFRLRRASPFEMAQSCKSQQSEIDTHDAHYRSSRDRQD